MDILRLVLVPGLIPSLHPFPLISLVILLLTFARHPLLIFHFLRLNLAIALHRRFFLRALSLLAFFFSFLRYFDF